MAIDLDDEILQDFLVEAGEILDSLGEQLVELEQSPGDLRSSEFHISRVPHHKGRRRFFGY